jgi:hypothetical protein
MSDKDIEQEIQAKGKTAARVTPADIDAAIVSEHYFTAGHAINATFGAGNPEANGYVRDSSPLNRLTICVLVLRNGFTVTGESACVSPENFDAEIGRKVARVNAVQKIWPLEGYLLQQRLVESSAQVVPRAEVYSREECRFNYCASPDLCKRHGRCVNT